VAAEVFSLDVRAQGVVISSTVEDETALGVAFPTFLARAGFYAFYYGHQCGNFCWNILFASRKFNV
jgi:hypothetical protein